MLTTVSQAMWDGQSQWWRRGLDELAAAKASICVNVFYDASPNRVAFGALQAAIQPHARYPVRATGADGAPRWQSVDLAEYRRPG
eukprot:3134283-Pyramimonas_sp.AAC.1